jgi:hypothetical protein
MEGGARWVGRRLKDCIVDGISYTFTGRDTECEACQEFFRDGLTLSFNRILTDEMVLSWKPHIQVSLVIGQGCLS